MLREYFFRTSSQTNALCRWTRNEPERWILIQLLRPEASAQAQRAIFTIHGPNRDAARFLTEEFGRRYAAFKTLRSDDDLVSVEVSNYLLPAYRGLDPVQMATQMLGPDAIFSPVLVHDGYIHIRVTAPSPPGESPMPELIKRLTKATRPEDFELIHSATWEPVARLKPRPYRLTPKQGQVLDLAIEFGYYDDPRRCTLEELSKALGVSKAAIHKHLMAAESKILKNHPH